MYNYGCRVFFDEQTREIKVEETIDGGITGYDCMISFPREQAIAVAKEMISLAKSLEE